MSRLNYYEITDTESLLAAGRWQARYNKVMGGRPALKSFREMEAALLAMPAKRLISGDICDGEHVCAIGAFVLHKEMKDGKDGVQVLDRLADEWFGSTTSDDTALLGEEYGMTNTLAWIIAEENDEGHYWTPEERYEGVLRWVRQNIARLEAKFSAAQGVTA